MFSPPKYKIRELCITQVSSIFGNDEFTLKCIPKSFLDIISPTQAGTQPPGKNPLIVATPLPLKYAWGSLGIVFVRVHKSPIYQESILPPDFSFKERGLWYCTRCVRILVPPFSCVILGKLLNFSKYLLLPGKWILF